MEEHEAAQKALALGAAASSELDDYQFSGSALQSVSQLEELAGEEAAKQAPTTYNAWEALRAAAQRLGMTISHIRNEKFDQIPANRLTEELGDFARALEDLEKSLP